MKKRQGIAENNLAPVGLTPIAHMVRAMLSAEISAEIVVLAVHTAELTAQPVDIASEIRRAKDIARKRNSAESKNLPSLSSSSSFFPKREKEEEEKKKKELSPKSVPLPTGWEPSAAHFEEGAALGFSRDEVLDQAQDMRIWAGGKGVRRPSWTMTFSGWMRRTRKTFVGQTRRKEVAKSETISEEKRAAVEYCANHDRQVAEAAAKRKGNGHAH